MVACWLEAVVAFWLEAMGAMGHGLGLEACAFTFAAFACNKAPGGGAFIGSWLFCCAAIATDEDWQRVRVGNECDNTKLGPCNCRNILATLRS